MNARLPLQGLVALVGASRPCECRMYTGGSLTFSEMPSVHNTAQVRVSFLSMAHLNCAEFSTSKPFQNRHICSTELI